jgi:hypothetical protein
MSDSEYKVVEASSLTMEDGAKELLNSPEMQPYSRYIEAAMLGGDIDSCVREIAALPLEKRYVWRVASALKWDSRISTTGTPLWTGKLSSQRTLKSCKSFSDSGRFNSVFF